MARRRLTEDKFAHLIQQFMSAANPRWHLSRAEGGYAKNTKDNWRRALLFVARPNCLGDVSIEEIRPALFRVISCLTRLHTASRSDIRTAAIYLGPRYRWTMRLSTRVVISSAS
jgi:hypothetical protein